jgi:hypothetical protein
MINEHRDNSYHRSPYSLIWRWRRLLVFPTEVNRKAVEAQTGFIPHQSEWLVRRGFRMPVQIFIVRLGDRPTDWIRHAPQEEQLADAVGRTIVTSVVSTSI